MWKGQEFLERLKSNIYRASSSNKKESLLTIFNNNYHVGKGAFGVVIQNTGQTVTKFAKYSEKEEEVYEILHQATQSNYIAYALAFSKPLFSGPNKLTDSMIVLKYETFQGTGLSLNSFISKGFDSIFEANVIRINLTLKERLINQLLEGLVFLHRHEIAHGDIKPDNILLNDENGRINLKYTDFGVSRDLQSHRVHSSVPICGTLSYLSPRYSLKEMEDDAKRLEFGTVMKVTDFWSLGITIYQLFFGPNLPWSSVVRDATVNPLTSRYHYWVNTGYEGVLWVQQFDVQQKLIVRDTSLSQLVVDNYDQKVGGSWLGENVLYPFIQTSTLIKNIAIETVDTSGNLVYFVPTIGFDEFCYRATTIYHFETTYLRNPNPTVYNFTSGVMSFPMKILNMIQKSGEPHTMKPNIYNSQPHILSDDKNNVHSNVLALLTAFHSVFQFLYSGL